MHTLVQVLISGETESQKGYSVCTERPEIEQGSAMTSLGHGSWLFPARHKPTFPADWAVRRNCCPCIRATGSSWADSEGWNLVCLCWVPRLVPPDCAELAHAWAEEDRNTDTPGATGCMWVSLMPLPRHRHPQTEKNTGSEAGAARGPAWCVHQSLSHYWILGPPISPVALSGSSGRNQDSQATACPSLLGTQCRKGENID